MFECLKDYYGTIRVNGKKISKNDVNVLEDCVDPMEIDLIPGVDETQFRIYVRKWMTSESDDNLEFHNKWNNGIPMPEREMIGTILEETLGMYKMQLKSSRGRVWIGYVSKSGILEMEEI